MLNTVPPPIPSPILPRRRGGQPSNRNALKTGLHARKSPTPFTPPAPAIPAAQPALFADSTVFSQAVLALRQQIDTLLQASQSAAGLRSKLTWHRAILHGITLLKQIMQARQRCLQPQQHLQFIAAHALELIRHDFRSSGITHDAYSFREKCGKSDLNFPASPADPSPSLSDFPHLFLTPHQCQILAPLLPPSGHERPIPTLNNGGTLQDCELPSPNPHVSPQGGDLGRSLSRAERTSRSRGSRRWGRPPASPLPLLDAIFWKIATHARWQDLPTGSPPMLTCRRYYRRLFLSGRLLTLYKALYQDLLTHGQTDLTALVNQGHFSLAGDQIILQPGLQMTWQVCTALLFMQSACQVSIRILRKTDLSRRTLFP